jgi:hypothetical protein
LSSIGFSRDVDARDGVAPYNYSLSSGTLPPGLALDPTTGRLSGTPTVAGTYAFTITATDANICTGSRDYALVVECRAITVRPGNPSLPAGTAYFIGIVLIVMLTGRLSETKGSLARAAFPLVAHLHWGWRLVEQARERGRLALDQMFDQMFAWCQANLAVEEVRLGSRQRGLDAIDSSTIARVRAGATLARAGKGYDHRAGKAVRANIVAALTTVVMIGTTRVGLVRRVRFGASCEEAVAAIFRDAPTDGGPRLQIVDAGIATYEQFAKATDAQALLERLRRNCALRCAPDPLEPGTTRGPGRPREHGTVLHPGAATPEVTPDEDSEVREIVEEKAKTVRVRRWRGVHHEQFKTTVLDVVRVDHPDYKDPLILGTTARELTAQEMREGYGHRWPVETNFFVAQDTCAMEHPRAWTDPALSRRIAFSLLCGSLLKAIAASFEAIPIGPWDREVKPSAGRLAHHLAARVTNFAALALAGRAPRMYRKIPEHSDSKESRQRPAA